MPARVLSAPLACLAIAFVLAACGGGDDQESAEAQLPEGCSEVEQPAPKKVKLKPPNSLQPPPAGSAATVETSCGTFEIALDTKGSPKTTASFAYLVDEGVYDGTPFHRVVPGFVIQGGDPKGDGTGGPGYSVDEPPKQDVSYTRGTVAMAKTAAEPPGRSGSQFFVVVTADAGLPTDYAVLGEVSSGAQVTDRIAELGDPAAGETGTPKAPVTIDRITIEDG
jgi:cyclophilin family peptidyl-prolyl cis-trans isomerase